MEFEVEGRYYPNSLHAFTFAQIQADRMRRPVEVHVSDPFDRTLRKQGVLRHRSTWHATVHPEGYKRAHVVKQPPGLLASAA